jgi:hypothetical protein
MFNKKQYDKQRYQSLRSQKLQYVKEYGRTHPLVNKRAIKRYEATHTKRLHTYLQTNVCPICLEPAYLTLRAKLMLNTNIITSYNAVFMHSLGSKKYSYHHIYGRNALNYLADHQITNPYARCDVEVADEPCVKPRLPPTIRDRLRHKTKEKNGKKNHSNDLLLYRRRR